MTKPMSRRPPIPSFVALLTPAEAGERIRASEAHVYRLIEDGELHGPQPDPSIPDRATHRPIIRRLSKSNVRSVRSVRYRA